MLSPTALLTQVEAAIQSLLTGEHSSYSIGSRSVTKLDLPQLFAERRMLLAEIERATGGGGFKMGTLRRPSRRSS